MIKVITNILYIYIGIEHIVHTYNSEEFPDPSVGLVVDPRLVVGVQPTTVKNLSSLSRDITFGGAPQSRDVVEHWLIPSGYVKNSY